jgi:hypothetical protein
MMGVSSMLDTLKYYQQLRSAGIEDRQAQAIAEGLGEVVLGSVATKADLRELQIATKADLQIEITGLRSELKADITGLGERLARLEGQFGTQLRMLFGLYAYLTVAISLVAAFMPHAR